MVAGISFELRATHINVDQSTNESSPHSSEREYADWTSPAVLVEAEILERERACALGLTVLIMTEGDSYDYWEGQQATYFNMSDYLRNGSGNDEPTSELFEQSNSLA